MGYQLIVPCAEKNFTSRVASQLRPNMSVTSSPSVWLRIQLRSGMPRYGTPDAPLLLLSRSASLRLTTDSSLTGGPFALVLLYG